ncbi:hypothetical protein PHYSODRAFT_343410 [Phytophthora sojae]|uniref:Kazal-like domain-containing protein n=1 Tax=Phytophthora sojae (strain P6497) TaxID=1094619 RepID=G5AJK2_PHYSP|nr:hypothetical protein PHYSODRAFT_343410 [Phytophthora sojae]EGZ04299.1 hypothetical protein PHYSODRAFT_343410 [Phytophthora sojae]|eukprot:XP_009540253.1 hypothetical protein PHYSODRAFT_343410 [Phytophthora sojae]
MKFAAGLVLAALAVTAANAGNPAYLRSSDDASASEDFDFSASDSLDASGSDACPDECPDKYEPVRDGDYQYPNECYMRMAQCLTNDVNNLFVRDSTDGSRWTFTVESLFGSSGSGVEKLDQFADVLGKMMSSSGSDDLSWLFDSDSESGSEDPTLVKGKGGVATKGKTPIYEDDSESGSDDDVLVKGVKEPATKSSKSSKTEKATKTGTTTDLIDQLFDDASEDGIIGDESDEEDPTLVKGATKGGAATKGKTPIYEDDSESGSDDDVLVKGGKEPATKSSKSSKTGKATKTGTTTDLIDQLFDDASEDGIIGDESDEEDPTLVKGATKGGAATKGKTPLYEEDDSESESASDEDDYFQQEQLQTSVAEKAATKSSKTLLL